MGCGGSKRDVPEDAHRDNKPDKDSHAVSPPIVSPTAGKHSEENPSKITEKPDHDFQSKHKEESKAEHPAHDVKHKEEFKAENPAHDTKHNEESKSENPAHDTKHKEESKPAQAGGHSGSLIARGDKLLKKAGPKERAFYEYLFSEECTDPALVEFRKIVPHFYGIEEIDGKSFMVLENLLTGFEHPNLLDCKIGKVTWTRDHNEKKAADQQNKANTTTTGSLGFRITGLVVKDQLGNTKESIVKDEGFYSINPENIHEYFQKIVEGDKHQVHKFIEQTERIIHWFKNQSSKIFFTASLFYVNGKNGKSQTRFIDLAYVYDAEGQHDHSNYYLDVIQGLESVVEIWKRLL